MTECKAELGGDPVKLFIGATGKQPEFLAVVGVDLKLQQRDIVDFNSARTDADGNDIASQPLASFAAERSRLHHEKRIADDCEDRPSATHVDAG
jgi:hypothetical protein